MDNLSQNEIRNLKRTERILRRLEKDKESGWDRQYAWQQHGVECDCGCVLTRGKLAKHHRTKIHEAFNKYE